MQLSAASLLAAQQSAKPQSQPGDFAAALSESRKPEGFAPIDFKQPAKQGQTIAPQGTSVRVGAAIDIRV